MQELLPHLLKLFRKLRYRRFFPFVLAALGGLLAFYVPLPSVIVDTLQIRGSAALLVSTALALVGFRLQRVSENKDGCIGVAFAIKADSEQLRQRVASDMVNETKSILERVQSDHPFYVFDLGGDLAESVTSHKSAVEIRNRCGAHMVIYGEAKQRKERGQNFYVLHLEGLVTHVPTPLENSALLSREMVAVMPLRQKIEEENEISGFEITSVHLAHSVKFVIATAALLSHDGPLAAKLLEDIASHRKQLNRHGNIAAIRRLKELLPKRQGDAYQFMSRVLFAQWEVTREPSLLKESVAWLEKDAKLRKSPSLIYLLTKAIEAFVLQNDIRAAKKWVEQCQARYVSHPEWIYSAAFLCALEGKVDRAMEYYDSAVVLENGHEIPFQVEGFIAWILEENPKPAGLNFCLGYINEKFKSDRISACRQYELFLTSKESKSPAASKATSHAQTFILAVRGQSSSPSLVSA